MKIEEVTVNILSGQTTVSEISDENCRLILRRLVRRHRNALRQLEAQLLADEQSIPPLEVNSERKSNSSGTGVISGDG